MEHSRSGESDAASSSEEPNAKKCKRDPNAQTHAKSVVVLLDSDVTVSKNNRNVLLMPNTIEMAKLKKPDKGQYGKIPFTSEMTQRDVLTALQSKFPILRNKRLGCASAADNRTRLDFHGDKRIWNGVLINRHTRGNSALYVLAEENHESEESQVLLEGGGLAATQRLKQLHASQMSSTADQRHLTGHHNEGESEMLQRGRVELTSQADHTTGGILQQDRSVVQKMQNDPVLKTIIADPDVIDGIRQRCASFPRRYGDFYSHLDDVCTELKVVNRRKPNIPATDTLYLSGIPQEECPRPRIVLVQGALGMRKTTFLPKLAFDWFDKDKDKGEEIPDDMTKHVQDAYHLLDNVGVAQASLKPVSMTSGTQQRTFAQTSEQGSSLQQPPPAAAAAAHNNVPVGTLSSQPTSTMKLSVNKTKRKRHSNGHQEFPLLMAVSEDEATDSGLDSVFESGSNHDTDQFRDTCIVHKITPCKGSTKGGDDFDIILRDIPPLEIDWCVACFQNCGTVDLDQTVNPFTLSGRTPKSLQGPGPVNVTLMSSDGSWQGGGAVYEYIDDPPTFEEFLSKVVTDRDMRRQLFNRMDKEMSSNKPRDGQTDSCGKTAPGSSSLNQRKCAWSVKLLQLLVYKAAEIDGQEFIRMIFSTAAGKVVFRSYRNSASLPEDIARTNGHLTLAYYLQDVNSRLSKESNSDADTETIDWLELKHTVDEEQSLTSQPLGYPESDDDERDYFADDEISLSSSPCHSNVFDSENEAQCQNSEGLVSEGQRTQLAYEKALRDGFVNVYRGRILLIGQDRAGKTSLKKSLLGLPFDPKEQSTEGIEVQASTCEIEVEQVKNWHSTHESKLGLQEYSREISRKEAEKLFDETKELERGHSTAATEATAMREDHFKEGGGLSNRNYLKNYQVDEIVDSEISSPSRKVKAVSMQDSQSNNAEHFPECGSEIELDEPEVIINATSPPNDVTQHVHQFLEYFSGGHAESDISKEKSVISVDVLDFPGQQLYYACHSPFLSSRALYILVHNLSKPLHAPAKHCVRQRSCNSPLENPNNETNLENLLSWLSTIHSITKVKEEPDIVAQSRLPYRRPPVLIVGTHADKPFEDITVMKSQIEKIISGREYGKHVVPPLFCVDNTRSLMMQSWRRGIFRSMWDQTEQKNTSDIQDLRDKIREVLKQEPYMGEKIPVRWFLFEKVIKALLAKQIYLTHIKQLQNYAEKHCFLEDADEFAGMISFYHGVGMIVKHGSTVVLKPQWLIDLLRQLITIPHFDEMDAVQTKCWQEQEGNGILRMKHVDHVFSKFIQQGVVKDDILNMMEQFGLIAKFSPSPSDVKYFVPAQLKTPPKDLCQMTPSHTDPCPLYIHFVHGFVPHGLFSQLVSRFICWCCKMWPLQHPKLYQNGAWFVIGKQIHDLIVIWNRSFIKVVLRQRMYSCQVLAEKSEELAIEVREFVEETLQTLSQELPYLSGLQYELCVVCPYCHHQGRDRFGQECSNHGRVSCDDEECFHLLKMNEGQQLICRQTFSYELRTVHGLEKWFLKRTSQDFRPSTRVPITQDAPPKGNQGKSDTALSVTLVASEWESFKGVLPTINRELVLELAQHKQVKVTLLVPQYSCSEEEKRDAESHKVSIREAERLPGYDDPLDWLSFPPRDLAIDIIVGYGGKLGKQAQVIRESHGCKWVQVIHTAPEELGMYKDYPKAEQTEIDLCKLADVVVTVGPKLKEAYSLYLHFCKKQQVIIQLTPGTFSEFLDIRQPTKEGTTFKVLTFGRGDPEDISLKGYDISAKAIVELKDSSYFLVFVGAPEGKQEKVAENLLQSGISRSQLIVRAFIQSKERLKELFCEVDLAIMPSRTGGFGLTALEALSAGLPILVSGNSGFGDTLHTLPLGKPFVVDSADPKDWAKAIEAVRLKDRAKRLQEIQRLRTAYEEKFSWKKQCRALVEKMRSLVHEKSVCMFADHAPQKNAGTATEKLLKYLACSACKEKEPTVRELVLCLTRTGQRDLADLITKYLLSSEDHEVF